jgi:protein SCO1
MSETMVLPRRAFLALVPTLAAFVTVPTSLRATNDVPAVGSRIMIDLVDDKNRVVHADDLRGKWLLVFFGYTSCPDICPTALFEISQVLKKLDDVNVKIEPFFISLDPARDEPKRMREYVDSFDPRIRPLTGTADQIAISAKSFGVSYFKVPGSSPNEYTIAHSSFVSELSLKVGDGGNREGGISWGCLTPPLLHQRSDMPCPKITSSS